MKSQMEAQRKSYINREIKELTIKYENEISTLVSELRKSREEAEYRLGEMQRLQQIAHGFNMRENEVKEIEDKMYEYENRFVMLSQENYRLNELLRWKVDELERNKVSEQQWRLKLEGSSGLEGRNKLLEADVARLTLEVQERGVSVSRASERLERLQLENSKLGEYETLVDQSATEI